jgi:hypothetical protein
VWWWLVVLVAWTAVAAPVAVLVGAATQRAQEREELELSPVVGTSGPWPSVAG